MMRKYLLIILFSITSFLTKAQTIEFDEISHYLGTINLNEMTDSVVYHDYYFTNTGDEKLKIKNVLSSCGCFASEWSKKKYNPKERGYIRLSYYPHLRKERQVSMVAEVYTNSLNYGTHKGVHNLTFKVDFQGAQSVLEPHYTLEKENVIDNNKIKQVANDDVYDIILGRIKNELQQEFNTKTDSKVEELAFTIRQGGYWQHIDYDCYFRTNWQPIQHLNNMRQLAIAYITPQSNYYGSGTLFDIINDAIKYWDGANPRSHNWWYNQIGGSQTLAETLVLLSFGKRKIDDATLKSLYLKLADSDPRRWTGANKLDIAKHHLYRGCLLRNDSIVRISSQQAFHPVHITNKEGVQEDMSYQQHGAQLYLGGYGIVFCGGISQIASILRDTPYALPSEQLELFSQFFREGFLHVFRGSYIDWSVIGRGISRENIIDNRGVKSMINRMIEIDPKHKEYYLLARKRFAKECVVGNFGKEHFTNDSFVREPFVGNCSVSSGVEEENILYHRSDYMVHNHRSYQATVRTASTRVRKTESGNGENLLGSFLSDGAFTIRQQGYEYNNIFSVWEWDKIPGTTSLKSVTPMGVTWGAKGTSLLTGGVSNGKIGAFAYKHNDHGFQATKSWFFLKDMVVALGSGITSDTMALHTTLEQSNLHSSVIFKEVGNEQQKKETVKIKLYNTSYVIHNNMAYIPLEPSQLNLKAAAQQGNWFDINYNERNMVHSKKVFNLIWEHPKGVLDASYSYIQLPNYNSINQIEELKREIAIVNTKTVQAIYIKRDDVAMVLFYEAGTYGVGKCSVRVDKPSLLILEGVTKYSFSNNSALKIFVVNLEGDSTPIQIKFSKKNRVRTVDILTENMIVSEVIL